MIARYEGRKRKAEELNLGWLAPFHDAIPEFNRHRNVTTGWDELSDARSQNKKAGC